MIATVRRWWLTAVGVTLLALAGWQWGPFLWGLIQDEVALQAFVAQLGWVGPIALIVLNALQIVIAPVPGYPIQVVAGLLYGPFWGGLWGSCGLLIGSMSAMWLARTFGRPLVERLAGPSRVAQWEAVIHSKSEAIWFFLLLGPTGDTPYYLAGLTHIHYLKIALITLLIRVPSVFVAAALGSGVLSLAWWQLALIFMTVGLVLLLFLRYQQQWHNWFDQRMQRELGTNGMTVE